MGVVCSARVSKQGKKWRSLDYKETLATEIIQIPYFHKSLLCEVTLRLKSVLLELSTYLLGKF